MIDVIYEDKSILICRKPSGLAVQNASIGKKDLESMVRTYLAEREGKAAPYLGIIHRLDQPVQGLVVFAKNSKSAVSLSAQVQDGRMKKYYLAVTDGIPAEKTGELIHYLKKDGRTNTSSAVPAQVPGAKKACLKYQVKEERGKKALLEIELFTGRHHQIRVQLATAGFPIVGDRKYHPAAESVSGMGLCAYRLELIHPQTGKKVTFFCEPEGEPFTDFSVKQKVLQADPLSSES